MTRAIEQNTFRCMGKNSRMAVLRYRESKAAEG
jgi:hypothetical protein